MSFKYSDEDAAFASGHSDAGRLKWQRRAKKLEKLLIEAKKYAPETLKKDIETALALSWSSESDEPMCKTGQTDG